METPAVDLKHIGITLTEPEHARLAVIAKADGRSIANMARWILLRELGFVANRSVGDEPVLEPIE